MDISKILEDLRGEREMIDEAIAVLERLSQGNGKQRRGRPPNWLVKARRKDKGDEVVEIGKGKNKVA